MKQSKRLTELHQRAIQNFAQIQMTMQFERMNNTTDRRFVSISGGQWEGQWMDNYANKPRVEINKVGLSIREIMSEYQTNRITVDFISKVGAEKDKLADTCSDLYRSDEQRSNSKESYDNAFYEGVTGGIGAWRLTTEYEDDYDPDNDQQFACFEPIYDADKSVYWDLGAKRADKSDAKFCYVITPISKQDYKDKYNREVGDTPVDSIAGWPEGLTGYTKYFDWVADGCVKIAEYYEVEEVKTTIFKFETLDGQVENYDEEEFTDNPELEQDLQMRGCKFVGDRVVKKRKIHKYLMDGGQVLKDCGYIAGKYIPIIMFYGQRFIVDNIERAVGHVRLTLDAQRVVNVLTSKLIEIASTSFQEKPIFYPEQINNHAEQWQQSNLLNYPFYTIDPMYDQSGNLIASGPIAYTKPPDVPPVLGTLLQISDTFLKELLGSMENGKEIQANISAKAIELVQSKIDTLTAIYMSNFAKAMEYSGRVWQSMVSELYIEKNRKMRGVSQDGKLSSFTLMQPVINKDTGELEYQNDLRNIDYEVVATPGPTSASKRDATVRMVIQMLQFSNQDPETMQILTSFALMNIQGQGVEDINDFYRKKLIKLGVVKPSDEELKEIQQELANTPPDPQSQYLQSAAQAEQTKSQKNQAETQLTYAKIQETQARAANLMAGITDTEQLRQLEAVRLGHEINMSKKENKQ